MATSPMTWWTSLTAIILTCSAVQAQVQLSEQEAEQYVESFIFTNQGPASTPRSCLEKSLSSKIAELDRLCKLTLEEKQKLQLAGNGDIYRFFRQVDELKREIRRSTQFEDSQIPSSRMRALQIIYECRLTNANSLFCKSIPTILSDQQLAVYTPWKEKEGRRNREVIIDWLLSSLAENLKLREDERRQMRSVLLKEIPICPMHGSYEMDCLIIQIGKLAKLEPEKLPVAKARAFFLEYSDNFAQIEPVLRLVGYFPPEDEERQAPANQGKK